MKKVLIIGANSYIGQSFQEYIKTNKINDLETSLASASDGSWNKLDFSKYDTVLHLSAIVHKKEKKNMKELYFKVNYDLAVEIAKKAKSSCVKHFIFMSTAAVYGNISGAIIKETLPNPSTFYGMSKLAAERDILNLQDAEFKVAVLRPPMVYGEGCKGNYTKLVKAAKYLFLFPKYHNKRSAISVSKLIQELIEIINNRSAGIYLPQDKEYLDTCSLLMNERKKLGKKTILLPGFFIKPLVNKINLIGKIFGDFYYI